MSSSKKNDKPVNLGCVHGPCDLVLPVQLGSLYTPEGLMQAISVDTANFFTIELVEEEGEKSFHCIAKSL